MESVLPGGLGTGALGGALDIPDIANPMAAPTAPAADAPAAAPQSPIPLGF